MIQQTIKYLRPGNLHDQISAFTKGMSVTKTSFELLVPNCTLKDFEWNHMDQQHRPSIHHTYEKGIRIASGENFAISLTQWKNWPLFITVSDAYVAEGLFYQSLTIAGIVFIHSIISMEVQGEDILLKDEWYTATHKFLKFLHNPINKKLYALNVRLQEEDAQIRTERFLLRKKGYTFRSDPPNYLSSNTSLANTVYPSFSSHAGIDISDVTETPVIKSVGEMDFIIKKFDETYQIWPAACPHEGGPLGNGKICDAQITCPWHGLKFSSISLSKDSPWGQRYGFEYTLVGEQIFAARSDAHPKEKFKIINA